MLFKFFANCLQICRDNFFSMIGIFIHVYKLIINFLSVSLLYSIWEMRIKLNWYTHV